MNKNNKSIILLSAGLDSLVALGYSKKHTNYNVELALTFDYGQKSSKNEIEYSKKICDLANDIRSTKIDINLLERRIEESIKFVRDVIAPIFDFRGNQRDKKQYLHPKYFALALIAFTFREMYDINNLSVSCSCWM